MPQDEPADGAANATESDQLVAPPNGEVAAENPPPPLPQSTFGSVFALTKTLIVRALVIYFISSFFRKPSAPTAPAETNEAGLPVERHPAWNLFENGTVFDLHVYMSEDFDQVNFNEPSNLLWMHSGLIYGDWSSGPTKDGTYMKSIDIAASEHVLNNGSLFIHVFATKTGLSPDPAAGEFYAGRNFGHTRRLLNKFKRLKYSKTHNLLSGDKSQDELRLEAAIPAQIVSHWHPNITINMVTDQTNWVRGSVPPPLDEYVEFLPGGRTYLPIVFLNDYWNMMRDYMPINETTPMLSLLLTFQPLTMFKWQLYAAQAMKNKWTSGLLGESLVGAGEEQDEDQDSLKETLLETNPYLLGLTILISIFHSVFELLAFKNDIQFWNNRKSLEGLSVRSVFFGVVQSIIVLLYVLDNDTNFMIRVSCFIGLGIEVWKIQKVVDVKFDRTQMIFGVFPKLTFADKGSYVTSSTKQYDNLAFKYLGWLCFPLLVGYSVYSLLYNEHKGWYSFVLNMLYGFLLTFGFIMMTPQLFINYKMKSVAHLPWRMMTYKFLNTFIDDIFAFVIKMPTMYRLGCFRDDIVFFIFLYQRWIYKVDAKRVNEFGFSGEMLDEANKKVALVEPPKKAEDKKKD